MYLSLPIEIAIKGEIKGNLDPDLRKVEQIRQLAEALGLRCTVDFGYAEVKIPEMGSIPFPEDAPAPPADTIEALETVICTLDKRGYVPTAQAILCDYSFDSDWVRAHLGYFADLEPKLRDAVMAAWVSTSSERPSQREAARSLGISTTVLRQRWQEGCRQVLDNFQARRKAYLESLDPASAPEQPVAILELSAYMREVLRTAGFMTVADVCAMTASQLGAKLKEVERHRDGTAVSYVEGALGKWGLSLATN